MKLFEMKMPLSEALAIAVIGISVVIMILALIAVFIILLSKAVRLVEGLVKKKVPASPAVTPAATQSAPEGINSGDIELIGTDEKTAAVIMAIVSEKSGIPLNRLSFKSVRLMDNDEKGGSK